MLMLLCLCIYVYIYLLIWPPHSYDDDDDDDVIAWWQTGMRKYTAGSIKINVNTKDYNEVQLKY
jgi:hypothetical protein